MKSTFWMTAQETEDELKSREIAHVCGCGKPAEYRENLYVESNHRNLGGILVGYAYHCYECAPRWAKSLKDNLLRG